MSILAAIKKLFTADPRRQFRQGEVVSRFLAKDVRRDLLVVSTTRIDEGMIVARVRTMNLNYVAHKLMPPADFDPPRELRLDELWDWTGQSWGGLPDGTSLVDPDRQRDVE